MGQNGSEKTTLNLSITVEDKNNSLNDWRYRYYDGNSPVNTRDQVDGANNKSTDLKKEDKSLIHFKTPVHEPDSF